MNRLSQVAAISRLDVPPCTNHATTYRTLSLSLAYSRFPALSKINTSQRGLKTCVNMVLHCLYVHITLRSTQTPRPATSLPLIPSRSPSMLLATYGQTMSDKAAYILASTAIRHSMVRPTILIKIILGTKLFAPLSIVTLHVDESLRYIVKT